jgi:hypothetical protein
VPLRKIVFARGAEIEVGDVVGGFNMVNEQDCDAGLLMKHYQSSPADLHIPLDDIVLLRIGRQLLEAVKTMYTCGYWHMDITPSNTFLWEKECVLSFTRDNAAVLYQRRGRNGPENITFLMLAVTLLNMFGALEKLHLPMTCRQIKDASIERVEHDQVKEFLKSFILET